jgi:hypothetical protein
MGIHVYDKTRSETAIQIRKIREAFALARSESGLQAAPEEFLWKNWIKRIT